MNYSRREKLIIGPKLFVTSPVQNISKRSQTMNISLLNQIDNVKVHSTSVEEIEKIISFFEWLERYKKWISDSAKAPDHDDERFIICAEEELKNIYDSVDYKNRQILLDFYCQIFDLKINKRASEFMVFELTLESCQKVVNG